MRHCINNLLGQLDDCIMPVVERNVTVSCIRGRETHADVRTRHDP